MAYHLDLTAEDVSAIRFVGGRYAWSWSLRGMTEGTNKVSEASAWEIQAACEEDTNGRHSMFPMLAQDSALYGKLMTLLESIV